MKKYKIYKLQRYFRKNEFDELINEYMNYDVEYFINKINNIIINNPHTVNIKNVFNDFRTSQEFIEKLHFKIGRMIGGDKGCEYLVTTYILICINYDKNTHDVIYTSGLKTGDIEIIGKLLENKGD